MKMHLIEAIDIVIKPSFLLLGMLSVIAISCCWIISILPIHGLLKLFWFSVIIISTTYYSLRDALSLLPWSWKRVEVSVTGELRLTNQRGEQFKPNIAPTSFVHSRMVIINSQRTTDTQYWFGALPPLIMLSNNHEETHRQLRVWLRWWRRPKD
jgi:hypothetical protein